MNLTRIFQMQKELDEKISARDDLNTIKGQKLHQQMMLAVLIEIAEFANEVQSFKYWKANKKVDNDKVLEEFADVLHFLGSLGYTHNLNPEIEPLVVKNKDINEQFTILFNAVTKAMYHTNKHVIAEILSLALGAMKLLKFSEEEILEWYEKKNRINHERVNNRY
ncbi:dUTP diphosphatase [Mycoplasmopsis columbina]|uniref:dUTPase n=1 Tax=Mycoplasmopsis columbina SF7 TaxID=1037410 RepID=F9UJS4_9BACT|nr:dUTP diphosphatase [Mycoplasmopsis columbina]EGV00270.1 hypothetical protein MCSF7_00634 [Mycoplasmopsis columbina SF7]VEU76867.1 Uncharacterized protein conserved in bacteria [Mycoplasmopsis columbina]